MMLVSLGSTAVAEEPDSALPAVQDEFVAAAVEAAAEDTAPVEEAPAEDTADVEEAPAEDAAPVEEAPAEDAADVEQAPAEDTAPVETTETGFALLPDGDDAPAEPAAEPAVRSVSVQIGDHIITAYGAFPEDATLQAVEIPADTAAQLSGKNTMFAYDIRLVSDGQVWQPEDHGEAVQLTVRSADGKGGEMKVDLVHVKADLMDEDGNLSEETVGAAIDGVNDGTVEKENLSADAGDDGVTFTTSSFSAFMASSGWVVSYIYNAGLYAPGSEDYVGIYSTQINPNTATAETAETIGMPSIADPNLDAPTTESPAIIQGAAVGYEVKTGAVEYETLKERVEPYSDYRFKIMEEQGTDGTTHRKLTGFDQTYVIVRLDVSEFYNAATTDPDNTYLHMKQTGNMALVPGLGMMDNDKAFADALGKKTGSYRMSDIVDQNGDTPYIDVLLFATGKLAAGADVGKTDAPTGDVTLELYVDETFDYNPELKYDPMSTDVNHHDKVLAKFFDTASAGSVTVSNYLVKGSDLALEVSVENSGGEGKDTGTTYWSLEKAIEDPYYDLPEDSSPDDENCGRTLKLMSEVPITDGFTLQGEDSEHLRKRTLDVNSFDIQIANNTTTDSSTYSVAVNLQNAWLTIEDNSNTTGAEMAIGNNASFVIDAGGKLIIGDTCQMEIEWDGATTTPTAGQTGPAPADILNNGLLNIKAGGEVVNNGVITIEGFEGKPYQPDMSEQAINSDKGCGDLTIGEGATLTNNGSLVVYGKLFNLGTLVNNGKYGDLIVSNDPDKGQIAYHKGVQIAWKDDVTQKNVEEGELVNGKDMDGNTYEGALFVNKGDILLDPGKLQNYATLINEGQIYLAAAADAIIPIEPDPATPTIVSKRITLVPAAASTLNNYGTLINSGNILPASVVLNDDGSFGKLTSPGRHPELFRLNNYGVISNTGYIYVHSNAEANVLAVLAGKSDADGEIWLYLYEDMTFRLMLPGDETVEGTFRIEEDHLVFTVKDAEDNDVDITPEIDKDGAFAYAFTAPSGTVYSVSLTAQDVEDVCQKVQALN